MVKGKKTIETMTVVVPCTMDSYRVACESVYKKSPKSCCLGIGAKLLTSEEGEISAEYRMLVGSSMDELHKELYARQVEYDRCERNPQVKVEGEESIG